MSRKKPGIGIYLEKDYRPCAYGIVHNDYNHTWLNHQEGITQLCLNLPPQIANPNDSLTVGVSLVGGWGSAIRRRGQLASLSQQPALLTTHKGLSSTRATSGTKLGKLSRAQEWKATTPIHETAVETIGTAGRLDTERHGLSTTLSLQNAQGVGRSNGGRGGSGRWQPWISER